MKIPLANPARELSKIKNFNINFEKQLKQGIYVGGSNVIDFENRLKELLKAKYVVSVNSGTDALYLSLKALGLKKNDEVLLPSFTFFATAECILNIGAKPVFVDIDPKFYTLDLDDLNNKITKKTKAIIPVHLFGNNSSIVEVKKIAKENNLKIIEDVAQAFGSKTKNSKYLGTIGDLGAFSFFPSKTLGGIGDGGCVATNSYKYFLEIMKLKNHGQIKAYEHEIVGGNSRLDSMNAFVLSEKLKIFDKIKKTRNNFSNYYLENLSDTNWILLPEVENTNTLLNYFTIKVPSKIRNRVLQYLNENNIGAAIYYKKPLHLQKAVLDLGIKKDNLPFTEDAANTVISLPLFAFPNDDELNYLIEKIKRFK